MSHNGSHCSGCMKGKAFYVAAAGIGYIAIRWHKTLAAGAAEVLHVAGVCLEVIIYSTMAALAAGAAWLAVKGTKKLLKARNSIEFAQLRALARRRDHRYPAGVESLQAEPDELAQVLALPVERAS